MRLCFTDNEKKAFLIRKGWFITVEEEIEERHVHGSFFRISKTTVTYASNGLLKLPFDHAFEHEIKESILGL